MCCAWMSRLEGMHPESYELLWKDVGLGLKNYIIKHISVVAGSFEVGVSTMRFVFK